MSPRRWLIVVLAGSIFASMGAQYRTANFEVHAPSQEVAQQVGQWAEYYRKAKAIEWLGQEMPNWPRPCPLHVTVNMEGPSGATSFNFHPQGGVMDMKMEIQGPLDRLLASVLPHEITHTVFAYHFRRAVPRWADEGGSVLSEDDIERERHNTLVRSILNRTQQFRLRQLFALKDYPGGGDKVMCLYAQGFSVSHYLVYISDRQTFLKFVGIGMRGNWDQAVQTCYGMNTVEQLEDAWLKHLRDTKGITIAQLTKNKEQGKLTANPTKDNSGTLVRLTAPPVQPLQPVPVVRGAMPGSAQPGQTFGSAQQQAKTGYLPDAIPGKDQPRQSWQTPAQPPTGAPHFEQQYAPIPVQLGSPQNQQPIQYIPPASSPVGFPRQ
jgi:hypothetical protein